MDNDQVLTLVTLLAEDETRMSSGVVSNDRLGRKWKGLTDVANTGPESSLFLLLAFTAPNPLAIPEQIAGNLIHVFLMKKPKEDQGMS